MSPLDHEAGHASYALYRIEAARLDEIIPRAMTIAAVVPAGVMSLIHLARWWIL